MAGFEKRASAPPTQQEHHGSRDAVVHDDHESLKKDARLLHADNRLDGQEHANAPEKQEGPGHTACTFGNKTGECQRSESSPHGEKEKYAVYQVA